MKIPFNKPFLSGKELDYIKLAMENGKVSGDGAFTYKCHAYFENKYPFKKCLLTTSCTDALEMCALLLNIKPGDEVIMPSYTFVSTANAFVLRGAKIVFVDSREDHPGIDENAFEALITYKTKAIVVVHYAGIACDMDILMPLAEKHKLWIVEDAAQAIDSFYKGRALGSIGHLSAFSFHETKNIHCGEGGMLVINDKQFNTRSEIIREKGTNRSSFFRGEVDKYGWFDIGSSFLPSDINAAFLMAQLENLELIQNRRRHIWQTYHDLLKPLADKGAFRMPFIPEYATNNAHMFYIVCKSINDRTNLLSALKKEGIMLVFHYLSLHKSAYYLDKHDGRELPNSDHYSDCLVRLPFYFELTDNEMKHIVNCIRKFFGV